MPKLVHWTPSSELVKIEYFTSQKRKPSSQSKPSSEHQTASTEKELTKSDICSSLKINEKLYTQKDRKKFPSHWKTDEKRNKIWYHDPAVSNIKYSKQLLQYAEEAMDSYSDDSSADEENTVFEAFNPT